MPVQTFTTLNDPLAPSGTQPDDINARGQIGGIYTTGGVVHGFLLSGGIYTTIDDPLGTHGTMATGINNAGQIVGTYVDSANHQHGFLYSGGFYTTVDDPSATRDTFAQGINDAGQIVGAFGDANGAHGFLETTVANPPAPPGTTADMVLRASNTSPIAGQYEIYDIGSNTILPAYSLGQVGTDWGFVTLGGFNGGDTSDMLLRNSRTGGFEVYDISNDITGAAFLGNVGLDWQVIGFGNFGSFGEDDMMLLNINTGGVEV